MIKTKTFAIAGGGIGGLTLAIALQKKGFSVKVYENSPELKPVGAGIVLAANALKALRAIGIDEAVISAGKHMKRFCIRNQKGQVLTQTEVSKIIAEYGTVNTLTLHRADLHNALMNHLEKGTLELGKGCVSFELIDEGVELKFRDGSTEFADYVIAADGINSVFRRTLEPTVQLRYSGYTCWRGITDVVPAEFDFDEATETWGAGKRFGIVPLTDGRVYWFATLNAPANDQVTNAYSIHDVEKVFSDFHFPVREIIAGTRPENMIKNDINDIPPLKRFAFGRVALLGDAAHATTPNLGQGACMAIEDAVVLANCLRENADVERAFIEYEKKRIARTTKVVNTSYQMGRLGQLTNPILVRFRNWLLRYTPERVTDKQLKFLFDVTFS